MTEAVQQQCRFFLLRYVPNPISDEFVNIGLVLLPPETHPELRFSKDWSRVKGLDPQADLELLDAFRDEIQHELAHAADQYPLLKKIEESFSNTLQASESKACLTASPAQEADQLARIYLEGPRRRASREQGPRQTILESMQEAFRGAGVWQRMATKIPVSKYSLPGDPLKIDCGYQANSTIKMFHATPLQTDVTAAKVLAFSYPELASGMQRLERAQAHLTAIVEDELDKNDEIGFALQTLDRAGIHVATVSDLAALAQTAARELRG